MLTNNSKALLEALEAKYLSMLDMVNDIARINIKDAQVRADMEIFIHMHQQKIHEAANKLSHSK